MTEAKKTDSVGALEQLDAIAIEKQAEGIAAHRPKKRITRNPSKAQALRVIDALDRALEEALALEEMAGNHFDDEALDEFICGLWHTEKAVLDAMGWKRDFKSGEISRKKKEA